jgi:transcriptional regulator with GAF, ATPase, and Fis domain
LPLHLQAKLLRALDRQEVRSIGSSGYRKVDFRIVAATNRDLKSEVRQGRFREDLYYRLAGARIHLPPLRERTEDIAPLAASFAGQPLPGPVLQLFVNYDWPGNVRQLRNCAQCLREVGLCPLQGHADEGPALRDCGCDTSSRSAARADQSNNATELEGRGSFGDSPSTRVHLRPSRRDCTTPGDRQSDPVAQDEGAWPTADGNPNTLIPA